MFHYYRIISTTTSTTTKWNKHTEDKQLRQSYLTHSERSPTIVLRVVDEALVGVQRRLVLLKHPHNLFNTSM